jgi:cytochrome c2
MQPFCVDRSVMRMELAQVIAAGALSVGLLAATVVVFASPEAGSNPPASAPPSVAAEAAAFDASAVGKGMFLAKGCGGCHTITGVAGASGQVGPNLSGVATRSTIAGGVVSNNGRDDLVQWILDPPALKAGIAMPRLGLTHDEAVSIATYLETLR